MDEEALTAVAPEDLGPSENAPDRVVWVEIVDIEPVEGEPDFDP